MQISKVRQSLMSSKFTERFFLAAFFIVIFKQCLSPYTDVDVWWHLRQGEEILKQGFLYADIFSFTYSGQPLIAHEWLCEVMMAVVLRLSGFTGLALGFAFLTTAAFGLVCYRGWGNAYIRMAFVFIGVLASEHAIGARPQILTLLFTGLFLALIESIRFKKTGFRTALLFPVLGLFWANCHGAFLIGPLLLIYYPAMHFLQKVLFRDRPGVLGKGQAIVFLGSAAACLLVSLVNPYGAHLLLFPFKELGSEVYRSHLIEWEPANFLSPRYLPFGFLIALGAVGAVLARRRLDLSEFTLMFGTALLGSLSARHIPLFAVVSTPFIMRFFGLAWQERPAAMPFSGNGYSKGFRIFLTCMVWLVSSLLIIHSLKWVRLRVENLPIDLVREYPVKAADYLKKQGLSRRPGFNEYDWGGFLLWKGIPVFVDGRAGIVYDQTFLKRYFDTVYLEEPWDEMASKYELDYALLKHKNPLTAFLDRHVQWRKIYRDEIASIFIREQFLKDYKLLEYGQN